MKLCTISETQSNLRLKVMKVNHYSTPLRAKLVLTILEPKVYTIQQCQSIVLHPASIYCKSQ